MTLQSSGPISLEDLRKEFGGNSSEPISFLKYYSGSAGNVSEFPVFKNSAIPVSGSGSNISLGDFYGTINADRVTITSVASIPGKGVVYRGLVGSFGDVSGRRFTNINAAVGIAYAIDGSQISVPDAIQFQVSVSTTVNSSAAASVLGLFAWTKIIFTNNDIGQTRIRYRASASNVGYGGTANTVNWTWNVGENFPEPFGPEGSEVTMEVRNSTT
jgi:hypothetical protein